jgi:DNA-binding winged helix-turn-helix (wHTH) protein
LSCAAGIRNQLARNPTSKGAGQMAMEPCDVLLKSGAGTPVTDYLDILAVAPRDPALLLDSRLTDKLAPFDREVIPERRIHAKGAGTHGNATHDEIVRFGRFCVLPRARQLLIDGEPVQLGSRAFDLLMVLIEAPGTLVTKNEIMGRVWPNRLVEESNLKMQISTLRKVLNTDRDIVKTVHGRGYVFTSNVTTASTEPDVFARYGSEPTSAHFGPALAAVLSASRSPRRRCMSRCRFGQ